MKPDVRSVPLTEIHECPWNPRRVYNPAKLAELAASIKATNGVIEPGIVRVRAKGGFELVAGSRRFRASKLAEMATMDCIVRDLDDAAAREFTAIENLQREDLTPYEESTQYKLLQDSDPKRFTVAGIAARVGKDESYIYRRLKLLKLAKPLVKALEANRLSIEHAQRLARLDQDQQLDAAGLDVTGRYDGSGVVWRSSPLLDDSMDEEDWLPGLDDHQPIHALDNYLRNKTHFEPTAEDTRHFQPELTEQLDELVDTFRDEGETDEQVRASVVAITDDSMARSRMGLTANAPMPLVPSRWREVKLGTECDWTTIGCHTQGPRAGQSHLICTGKTKCERHFTELKRKRAAEKKRATQTPAAAAKQEAAEAAERHRAEEAKRKRIDDAKYWNGLLEHLRPAVLAHCAKLRLTAGLVKAALQYVQSWNFERHVQEWGVKLTDKNVVQALGLGLMYLERADETGEHTDAAGCRHRFLQRAKLIAFNLGAVEQKYKAELKKAEKSPGKKAGKKAAKQ